MSPTTGARPSKARKVPCPAAPRGIAKGQDVSSKEIRTLVESTASRLRLVQADLADHEPDQRQAVLAEEVERAIHPLVPADREEFLRELETHFPSWEGGGIAAPATAPSAPVAAPIENREDRDISYHLNKVLALSGNLSAEQKESVSRKLAAAGFTLGGIDAWPDSGVARVSKEIFGGRQAKIDSQRVLDLLALLAELAIRLEPVVWQTWQRWQKAHPAMQRRQRVALGQSIAAFLSGDADTPRGKVQADVEEFRRLTAAVAGSAAVAGQMAARELTDLSPARIREYVEMEKSGGFMKGKAERYWEKFQEIAGQMDESSLEAKISKAMAEHAGTIIGIGR